MDHLVLHKMVEGAIAAAEPARGAGEIAVAAASIAGSWVYPAALLAAPLVRLAEDYTEKGPKAEQLAELYRKCLLHALETCTKDNHSITRDDRDIVELWEEGLRVSVKGDLLWQAILEDNLSTRLLSADLRDPSK